MTFKGRGKRDLKRKAIRILNPKMIAFTLMIAFFLKTHWIANFTIEFNGKKNAIRKFAIIFGCAPITTHITTIITCMYTSFITGANNEFTITTLTW